MSDVYSEITNQSWLSRLGGSIKGILVGIVLILVAVGALFWNEGRTVKERKALNLLNEQTVVLAGPQVAGGNEGKPVHFTGKTATDDVLDDDTFGVRLNAVQIKRTVEMYQWKEKKETKDTDRLGGGSRRETTYSYSKVWDDEYHDSSDFNDSSKSNPPMPHHSRSLYAKAVSVGEFSLPDELISQVGPLVPLDPKNPSPAATQAAGAPGAALNVEPNAAPTTSNASTASTGLKLPLRASGGWHYLGNADPGSPRLGDIRVKWQVVRPGGDVSVIGVQAGRGLRKFEAGQGSSHDQILIEDGIKSKDQMIATAQATNTAICWIVRAVGFVVCFIGFVVTLRPFRMLAAVLPLFAQLADIGIAMVSFVLSLVVTLLTIAVGWLFYRPVYSVILIAAVVGLIVWLRGRAKKVSLPPIPQPAYAGAGSGMPPPPIPR
jgi:hypothetical protein